MCCTISIINHCNIVSMFHFLSTVHYPIGTINSTYQQWISSSGMQNESINSRYRFFLSIPSFTLQWHGSHACAFSTKTQSIMRATQCVTYHRIASMYSITWITSWITSSLKKSLSNHPLREIFPSEVWKIQPVHQRLSRMLPSWL